MELMAGEGSKGSLAIVCGMKIGFLFSANSLNPQLIKTYVSSSYPKTLEEAKPAFDDPTSKEAMESLTSTKSLEETYQTTTP
ncbi:hypothetical protein NC651_029133 [Populus alba x Populus x berolinensis]|nr:hypothetical protein NC651_029133 [Populus alba x Populus x berolinensis]